VAAIDEIYEYEKVLKGLLHGLENSGICQASKSFDRKILPLFFQLYCTIRPLGRFKTWAVALIFFLFLDKKKSIESQIQEHTKPHYTIKDNVFAAALFFFIYTSTHDTFEDAVKEIISRKEAAKKEAALSRKINK